MPFRGTFNDGITSLVRAHQRDGDRRHAGTGTGTCIYVCIRIRIRIRIRTMGSISLYAD